MNNSNLVKITLGLAFSVVATFVVNSNDITPNVNDAAPALTEVSEELMVEVKNRPVAEVVESTVSSQKQDFAKILSKFDQDSNGSLSEDELSASDNDTLKIAFKNIDSNEDGQISSSEYLTH